MAPALLGALATAPTLLAAAIGRLLAPAGPVRAAHARAEAARRLDAGVFTEPPAGTRWLVCDATACAHLTTRHTPTALGAYECAECGHIQKGDPS